MRLTGHKIAVLMESDFYEPEILYYKHRFPEEGAELHFLSRLWGEKEMTFQGHEHRMPFTVTESFEDVDEFALKEFSAVIVPSGMVADRLRYTEDINALPPATQFLQRAFAQPDVLKGIICHGMWLVAPVPELVRGRRVVAHNNLLGDVKNMGAIFRIIAQHTTLGTGHGDICLALRSDCLEHPHRRDGYGSGHERGYNPIFSERVGRGSVVSEGPDGRSHQTCVSCTGFERCDPCA